MKRSREDIEPHDALLCPVPEAMRRALPVETIVGVDPPSAELGKQLSRRGITVKRMRCEVCATTYNVFPSARGVEELVARNTGRIA